MSDNSNFARADNGKMRAANESYALKMNIIVILKTDSTNLDIDHIRAWNHYFWKQQVRRILQRIWILSVIWSWTQFLESTTGITCN